MPIRTEVRSAFDDGRHDYVGTWEQLVYLHEGRLALFAHPARDDHSTPTAEASASGAARHTPLGALDLPTTMDAHTGPSEPILELGDPLLLEPPARLLHWTSLWAPPNTLLKLSVLLLLEPQTRLLRLMTSCLQQRRCHLRPSRVQPGRPTRPTSLMTCNTEGPCLYTCTTTWPAKMP